MQTVRVTYPNIQTPKKINTHNMNPLDPTTPLPNDYEAEKALLSSVMNSPVALAVCESTLTLDHFYSPKNANVWRLFTAARAESLPLDLVTLLPLMQKLNIAAADVADIFIGHFSDSTNFAYYLRSVCDKLALRNIFKSCYQVLRQAVEPDADPVEVIGAAKCGIALAETTSKTEVGVSLKELWFDLVERMQGKQPTSPPIATGIEIIDRRTRGGPRRQQMAVIAALRHVGKTALARQIAMNCGASGFKTLCFFAESSDVEESVNTMAVAGSIATKHFTADTSELNRGVSLGMHRVLAGKIPDVRIDTSPHLTCDIIEQKCRLLKATQGLDVVFVDYLQFMGTRSRQGSTREQLVSEDARRLKVLARELDVVLYLLAQLSDDIKPEDRPEMSNLRESRGPANHADIVLLMYAPKGIAHDPDNPNSLQQRYLVNAKWRGVGAFSDPFNLRFKGSTQQFLS